MTSPTPEPTPADRERALAAVADYESVLGGAVPPARMTLLCAVADAIAAVRADAIMDCDAVHLNIQAEQAAEIERLRSERDEALDRARNMIPMVRASINAVNNPIAWAAMMESERDAALAREAALVEALHGALYQDVEGRWFRYPPVDELAHAIQDATLSDALDNSTAAAEARDKKLKDEARREGMEQAAKICDRWIGTTCDEPHTDNPCCHTRMAASLAQHIRAAAAPETP